MPMYDHSKEARNMFLTTPPEDVPAKKTARVKKIARIIFWSFIGIAGTVEIGVLLYYMWTHWR